VRSSHAITAGLLFLPQANFFTVEPAVLKKDRRRTFVFTANDFFTAQPAVNVFAAVMSLAVIFSACGHVFDLR